MDLFEVSAREKRSTFVKVVVGCLLAFIIAPPLAQAAAQAVKVTNPVRVKDSGGGTISASAVGAMGLFEAEGSSGALDVRTFAGGGGVLGAADCSAATPLEDFVAVTDSIVTGIIITGNSSTWTATAAAFGPIPLANWTMSSTHTDVFIGAGTGLTITSELRITCTGTNGNLIVVGQPQS